jgi:3-methylcrotonyl-CoA carboxylase alpha subunit
VDAGVVSGQAVTVHYDPLLAKVIAHGATRDEALDRLHRALGEYDVLGLRHNISFLRGLLQRPELRSNDVYTRFIEDHLVELQAPPARAMTEAAAALAAYVAGRTSGPAELDSQNGDEDIARDPWALLGPVTW